MNSYKEFTKILEELKTQNLSRPVLVVKIAESVIGWPYVFGGYGQYCTTANRESYANRSTCPEKSAKLIYSRCQVLSGKKSSCAGCKYYPGGARVLFFDCRGLTRKVLEWAGLSLVGAGATSQYNNNSNWSVKGDISGMPSDKVCCVFQDNGSGTKEHTGIYCGDGTVIHCQTEVKREPISKGKWTHFAMPNGLYGDISTSEPIVIVADKPTLKKGSKGADVKTAQSKLLELGYSLGSYGVDGSFGSITQAAVKAFQKDYSLPVTGIINNDTWAALEAAKPPEPRYTAKIQHLTKSEADVLVAQYKNCDITKE